MYRDLHEFIEALERAGELVRIKARVSPVLEIAAIADRVSKSRAPHVPSDAARRTDPRFHDLGGPALLFENVEGSEMPVLINAFGSYRRMEIALGVEEGGFEELAERLGALVQPQPPRSIGEAIAKAKQFAPLLRIGPRMTRRAPCQQIVETGNDIDLTRLPLIRCWPLDGDLASVGYPAEINEGVPGTGHPDISPAEWGRLWRGRYVTLGGVHTIHADDADEAKPRSHNIGMYRVQLFGKRTMAMHWHIHHDGAAHWRSWKKLGKPMPVAIALGGEAVLAYAATAPLPPGLSELLMAGYLNGRGVRLARCRTVPLRVPANTEIVIEGYVSERAGEIGFDPREADGCRGLSESSSEGHVDGAQTWPSSQSLLRPRHREELGAGAVFEGPFGDHTGFYSLPDRYPILTVTAVTRRHEAVYPTTIVGLPPQEDYFLGKATERIFLPLLKVLIPDIEDYDLPMFGAFHNCAFIKIKKAYPLHARRVMHAIWGAGQMAWTKMIVVVGEDVDVHDHAAVLRAISERCDPQEDIERVRGPLDILDHAAPVLGAGTKIGFDATGARHGATTPRSDEANSAPVAHSLNRSFAAVSDARLSPETGWLSVACEGDGRTVAEALRDERDLPAYVVLVGESVDLTSFDEVMFHMCANWDPGRDTIEIDGSLIFDATPKTPDPSGAAHDGQTVRDWPPILQMDGSTDELVDRRWSEYGIER